VDVVKFLAESMRSIAHGEKEKRDSRPPLVPIASHGDISEGETESPTPDPTPEESLESDEVAAAMRTAIISLFDDDEVAQIIVEGIFEEMEGEELRTLTDLDTTAYQSKRKLIRRRIDKHFPDGWKP
jgi:RNA polymerase sigma-70 factor (ECF subfamily)